MPFVTPAASPCAPFSVEYSALTALLTPTSTHRPHLAQAEEMKDKALRTMADMENLRDRTARTMAEAKQFAVQVGRPSVFGGMAAAATVFVGVQASGAAALFCWRQRASLLQLVERIAVCVFLIHRCCPLQGLVKNLLEVADILELAAGSVPPKDVSDESDIDRDRALKLLRSLREGVLMTDTVLLKVRQWVWGVGYGALGAVDRA